MDDEKDSLFIRELTAYPVWPSGEMPIQGQRGIMDALIARRAVLKQDIWIYWLVREKGLARLNGLAPDPEFMRSLEWAREVWAMLRRICWYPVLMRDGVWVWAVGRPDLIPSLPEASGPGVVRSAATLDELALFQVESGNLII
jgi:hypothetical protein